jgi:hypothetical protein
MGEINRGIASYEFAVTISTTANVRNRIPEFLANYVTQTMDEYRKQVELMPFRGSIEGCCLKQRRYTTPFEQQVLGVQWL